MKSIIAHGWSVKYSSEGRDLATSNTEAIWSTNMVAFGNMLRHLCLIGRQLILIIPLGSLYNLANGSDPFSCGALILKVIMPLHKNSGLATQDYTPFQARII